MCIRDSLEALARIAEDWSPPGVGTENLTIEERKNQDLYIKLEALVVRLMSTVCDSSIKDNYTVPTKSIFDPDFEETYVVKKRRLSKVQVDEMNQQMLENLAKGADTKLMNRSVSNYEPE
eukprot:TRINITY_DN19580_c0_g1_i2.p1 TRINITY_DN19580_c0_g1~~TRINITY_DN19580_c0_g1_i2.p1  ORF type:complete len:120 (+),score=24.25 TRINITY_DN19580_c0_g1_i2:63-422(+)